MQAGTESRKALGRQAVQIAHGKLRPVTRTKRIPNEVSSFLLFQKDVIFEYRLLTNVVECYIIKSGGEAL